MNRAALYREARREYVTSPSPVSIRTLAPKYERSYSSMARMARIEGWEAERLAFQERTNQIITTTASEALAERLIRMNDSFLAATEESIEIYRKKIRAGEITPTPADISKLVMTVRDMLAPKAAEPGEAPLAGLHISESGLRSLAGAVEAAARSRLVAGGVGEAPEPKLVGSSQG